MKNTDIETIFDHNPTEEELDEFFISKKDYEEDPDSELLSDLFACRTKEGYLKEYLDERDPGHDMMKWHLSALFFNRKDMKNAYKYAEQITDSQYRQDRLNLLGDF